MINRFRLYRKPCFSVFILHSCNQLDFLIVLCRGCNLVCCDSADPHAVNGSFYKLTFAPTFKVGSIGDFFSRPEIRFYTSWMDWSKKLDNYANDDALGSNGFKSGGEWSFGMQMETWF